MNSHKTVVITGANRGIGLSLAEHYHRQGWSVVGVCRQSSSELDNIADVVLSEIDVRSRESLVMAAQAIELSVLQMQGVAKIDLLINNAGVFMNETFGELDYDSIDEQFQVNALAPLKVTEALRPLLKEGSKIAMVTSRMGSIADNGSGAYYGYRASKAALNAFGKSLSNDLKPEGIAVALLHPGFVQTQMVGFQGDIAPQQAALGLALRIEELSLENSGGFWHSNGELLPW